jgi:hypothetical protein
MDFHDAELQIHDAKRARFVWEYMPTLLGVPVLDLGGAIVGPEARLVGNVQDITIMMVIIRAGSYADPATADYRR